MLILRYVLVLLCLLYMPLLSMPAAQAAGVISLGDAYANSPTMVSIPLSLSNNINPLAGIVVQVQYDSTQLSLVPIDVYAGAVIPSSWLFDVIVTPPTTGTLQAIDIQIFDATTTSLIAASNISTTLATLNFSVHAGVATDALITISTLQVFNNVLQDIYTTAGFSTKNGSIIYGVQDITPPTITQPVAIYTEARGILTVVPLPVPTVSDNVDMGLIANADNMGPYPVGTTRVLWSARDSSGNVRTTTQDIIIQDTTPPIIAQPADIIVAATDSYGTAASNSIINAFLHSASVSDVVGVIPLPANDAPAIFPLGTTSVTFSATDFYGNAAAPKTATVTISDQTPPILTVGADIYIEATSAATTVNWGQPVVSDNVDVGLVALANRVNPLPVGITVITWSVSDSAGNITIASQQVIVSDSISPNITAPANIVVAAVDAYGTASSQINIAAFLAGASANDVVDGAIIPSHNAPNTLPLGINTVTFTATDANQNSSTSTATVTVVDQTPPVITPPANITVAAIDIYGTPKTDPYVQAFLSATVATDNVAIDVYGITNNAPANLLLGSNTITFTATDIYGNSSSVTALLIVQDQNAPLVQAPAPIIIAALDVYGVVVAQDVYAKGFLGVATAKNNLGQTLTVTNNAPTQLPIGITTVIFSASDIYANNNTNIIGTATSTINVVDMQAPQLYVPASNLLLAAQDAGGVAATDVYAQQFLAAVTAFDNIDGYTLVQNNAPAVFPIGNTPVQFVSSDNYGNTVNASTNVQVVDLQKPVVTAPAAITVDAVSSNGTSTTNIAITAFLNAVSAIDNVDGLVQTIINNAPNPVPLGTTLIIFSATDMYGNIGSATATITVVDNTAPLLIVPPTNIQEARGTLTPIDIGKAAVTDNVDQNLQAVASNFGPFAIGTHTIIWTVQDTAGNSASGTQIVTVIDTTPPAISTPQPITFAAVDVAGIAINDAYVQIWLASVRANDIVEGAIAAVNITNDATAYGGFFPIGQTLVTFTVSDNYGNTGSANSLVTVADITRPILIVPADITVNTISKIGTPIADAAITAFLNAATASDNVDGPIPPANITNDATAIAVFPMGTTVVTFSVNDAYGNLATATANIIVTDLTPPTIIAPADIYTEATATLTMINLVAPLASDNIDPAPVVSSDAPIAGFPVGINIVHWTATDVYGNNSTVSQQITITDTTPPILTAPPQFLGVIAAVDSYGTPMTDTYVAAFLQAAVASDLVSGTISAKHNIAAGTVFSLGRHDIIWQATDNYGNSSTATAVLEVTDQTPPIITPPIDLYVFASDVYGVAASDVYVQAFLNGATAIDNVASILPAISNDSYAITQFALGVHTVVFSVADLYGNASTAMAYIVVHDGTPTITSPSNKYVMAIDAYGTIASHPDIVAWLAVATAFDQVDGVLAVSNNAPAIFPLGVTIVTFSAIDSYGNSNSAVADIIITDQTPPRIIPPANIIISAVNAAGAPIDAYVQNSFLAKVVASDNVDTSVLVNNNIPIYLPLGITAVSFTATDAYGNSTRAIATITVVDKTPPTINTPLPITINATSSNGIPQSDPYIAAFLQSVSAQDNVAVTMIANDAPTLFAMGNTAVTFSAQDAAGNRTTASVSVLVNNMSNMITNWQSGLILAARGAYLNDVYTWQNLIVVVGDKGLVFTSTDGGINWTKQVSGTFSKLNGITWDGKQFIAVGAQGVVITSPNAINWTTQQAPTSLQLERVIFAHGQYVAVGWFGTVATSPDAVVWTLQKSGTSNHLFAVGADARQFIAIGTNGEIITSTDGIIWTKQISNTTAALYAISFDASRLVIVGLNGAVLTSNDAIIWTKQQSGTTTRLVDMIWGSGQFIAVGEAGIVLSSPNGINWTQQAVAATTSLLNSVTWTGSAFLAVGQWATTLRSGVANTDLIAPIVIAPANVTITALDVYGVAATDATIAAFLTAATAWDNKDAYALSIIHDAPAIFPQGTTTVTFSATDSYGNTGTAFAQVTVNVPIVPQSAIPTLVGPNNGNTNVTVPVAGVNLQWQISAPNPLYTYTLLVSSSSSFTNIVQRTNVTTQVLAGSPLLLGVIFGMLAWYRRRIILAAMLISICIILLSCGGGSGGSASVTTANNNTATNIILNPNPNTNPNTNAAINNTLAVRNLQPKTTYFWKMVVNDTVTGASASSAVWQFTTQ